jgi:hypothetical protein
VTIVALEHLALIGDVTGELSEELEGIGSLTARGRAGGLVGVVGNGTLLFVALQSPQRNRISGTVTSKPDGELLVVGSCPDSVVRVETRMRPGEHALSRLDVHGFTLYGHLEHGAAESLRERSHVVERQRHEGAVGAKTAVGDEQM